MCIFLYLAAQVLTDDINVLTFKELFPESKVVDRASYDDGTILLRVTRSSNNLMDCNSQGVNLRLIHPDGTISSIDLNVSIPNLNYCLITGNMFTKRPIINNSVTSTLGITNNDITDKASDAIRIYAITDQYILVTYFCKLPDSFDICGLLLTWDSRVLSNATTGAINVISNGTLNNIARFNRDISKIFPIEDGGYGIIITKYNDTTYSNFNFPVTIYVTFIPAHGTDTKGPFQIYTRSIDIITTIKIVGCHISYVFLGYNCLIYINHASNIILVDVNFLSSGSIMSTHEFIIDPITSDVWNVLPLHYGGNCIMAINMTDESVTGIIYSDGNFHGLVLYGNVFIQKTFPSINSTISPTNITTVTITFLNDIKMSDGNISIWEFSEFRSILRQSFSGSQSQYIHLFRNKTVVATVLSSTFNKVNSIYYVTVDNGFVKDAKVDQQLLGVKSTLWNFTTDFSLGNDKDDGKMLICVWTLMMLHKVQCALSGISSTGIEDVILAIVRFTPEGSTFYENLSSQEQSEFSTGFSRQLASIIPCDTARISTTKKYQYDRSASESQILFRVYIGRPTSSSEINSDKIIQDMDTLIRNKAVTLISKRSNTVYLDSSFGCFRA
ncbi:16163_t:CDS:2, partial [Racocetra fulgida]